MQIITFELPRKLIENCMTLLSESQSSPRSEQKYGTYYYYQGLYSLVTNFIINIQLNIVQDVDSESILISKRDKLCKLKSLFVRSIGGITRRLGTSRFLLKRILKIQKSENKQFLSDLSYILFLFYFAIPNIQVRYATGKYQQILNLQNYVTMFPRLYLILILISSAVRSCVIDRYRQTQIDIEIDRQTD